MLSQNGSGELRRDAESLGLPFASLSAIIGSGWLLGPLAAAKLTGESIIIVIFSKSILWLVREYG
ncbi:MAG: hypothetical protein ACYCX8_11440 [Acidimicrobiales bacterium]